jgi:transposase
MFTSKLFSRDTQIKLYIAYLHPIVMYGCETCSTTQGYENKLLTFERKVFRKIYGPVLNPITGLYERRKNADLSRLYNTSNIQDFLRSKRLEWAGHVWRAEGRLI